MRLALVFQRPDVRRFMQELKAPDLALWEAYERAEGYMGERAAWERIYQLARVLAGEKVKNIDLMPWLERPRMTPKAFRAQFAHLVKKK
jgi:hypothetical protein